MTNETETGGKAELAELDYQPTAPAPLDGVRVLDLSRLVAGNALTHVLADFGAEVIKVERPGQGDDLRNWQVEGISIHWKVYARNKKSLSLNLRQAKGRELLLRLVEGAQVLVENFLPGTLEKWDLGPEVLHRHNPGLVIVRISGWGQDGPDRGLPGFGSLVEARTGFAAMNGFGDRPPVLPPLALADMVAGLYGGVATLVALRHREVGGGGGQVIDLPLFDPLLSILGPQAAQYELTGEVAQRTGSRSTTTAPRNTYQCADGRYVALSASMQSMAERLLRTIGREELIDDPRFRSNADRVRNNDELDPIVAEFMARRSQAEVLEIFQDAGVTVGPVHDTAGMLADPLVRERAVMVRLPDDEMDGLPMHNIAARLSATPGLIRRPAPALGEHNAEILGQLGLGDGDLAALAKEGVI
ncbi:MAG: CoA transferase [Alphaproteobacteria bacterium]|nr:CoA transferase [Alphaproteobacteria bacterium]MDP6565779.1 CoA transferase [Alphaproteobacteria bacterium]MDP6813890.1 CoA transferase [Alphaproteobacteria bacterium]